MRMRAPQRPIQRKRPSTTAGLRAAARSEDTMTIEQFADEDAGLELPELIAALIEQADAMQVSVDE